MSVAANAVGEVAMSGDSAAAAPTKSIPRKRRITAKADRVQQPEAR